MAVQAVGGVSAAGSIVPTSINDVEPVGAGAASRRAQARPAGSNSDSTVVISKVTRTRDDGSTVTTITYADGHTETETTPPKFSANENQPSQETQRGQDEGRITGVDILA